MPIIIFKTLIFLAVVLLAGLVTYHLSRRARPRGPKPR